MFTVTAPTKRLVPVAELSLKVPVIEAVPLSVKLYVLNSSVPDVMVRLVLTVTLLPKVAVWPVLLRVKLL